MNYKLTVIILEESLPFNPGMLETAHFGSVGNGPHSQEMLHDTYESGSAADKAFSRITFDDLYLIQ